MPPVPNTVNINGGREESHGSLSSSSSSNNSNNQRQKASQSVEFTEETFNIVKYVLYYILQGETNGLSCPSPEAKRFRELVEEILNRHDVYDCICAHLEVTPSNVQQVYHGVIENMFEDGVINWGRLVSLVGFSVKVAEHLRAYGSNNHYHDDAVVELASDVLVQMTGSWIVRKGGWADVLTHFANKQCEPTEFSLGNGSWMKGILVTATLGLGALFAISCK